MSIKKMVSVDLAIQTAMEDMGMEDDRFRPKFTRWAIDAERKIGSFYSYKRDYVKLVRCDANHYEIPCHVVGIVGIIFGCVSLTNCGKIFRNQYNYYGNGGAYNALANYFTISVDGVVMGSYNRQWEIQDNKVVFLYPQTQEEITIDCIIYQIDERGFPLVNETHIDAIAQYIKMMRADGSIWIPSEQSIGRGDKADLTREWNRKCSLARGIDGAPTSSEMGEIVEMYNDHLSGARGIVWRYMDEFYWLGGTRR